MFQDSDLYNKVLALSNVTEDDAWMFAFDHSSFRQEIIDSVRDRLFTKGTNEQGRIIGVYSPASQRINPEKIAGTPYTLKDTGRFYQSIYMGVFRDYFFIDANPIKGNDNLFQKFGDGIIGLDEEQKEWLNERIAEYYYEYIEQVLQRN